MDSRQVDVNPQGDDPDEQHGEDHDKGEDITCCLPAKNRAATTQIDGGELKVTVPRVLIKQSQLLVLQVPLKGGSAVQLGTHLFISGEIRILIGVENLISQQDLETVDGAPGGQSTGVSGGDTVIVQHQVRSAVQREGTRQIDIHPLSILQVIPAVQLFHAVRCGRALKPQVPQREKNGDQHCEDQDSFNSREKPGLVSHGIGLFSRRMFGNKIRNNRHFCALHVSVCSISFHFGKVNALFRCIRNNFSKKRLIPIESGTFLIKVCTLVPNPHR